MSHITQSIKSALQKAPREPFSGNPLLKITDQLILLVEEQRSEEQKKHTQVIFWDGYMKLQEYVRNTLSQEQKKSLNIYLGITAFEMTSHQLEFSNTSSQLTMGSKWAYAAYALNIIAKNLAQDTKASLEHIEEKSIEQISGKRKKLEKKLINSIFSKIKKNDSLVNAQDKENHIIAKGVERAKNQLQNNDGGSIIRQMMSVFNEIDSICKAQQIRSHLKNLTLGDVSGKNMPSIVQDAMGYDPLGPKGLAIHTRAKAYEAMLFEAGLEFDPHRYDLPVLGWKGLRERFIEYGQQFNLYSPNEVKESMIGEGGIGTLLRVFTAARMQLQKEQPHKTFSAYFSNPAFRMVGDAARDAGLAVVEVATNPEDGFFPDPDELNIYFLKHPECKVFIFIPIGNPNADFPLSTRVKKIVQVVKKHKLLLVNDFAYLGTGDNKKNTELAHILSTYKKRIDCFSMSKIFGRTGLRCGCAITTDEAFAQQFSPAAKHIQLGMSYPMQQEAMAIWDFVSQNDRNVLNSYYKTQQKNILHALHSHDAKRIVEGKKPLIDPTKPIFDQAGLYLYIPLSKGFDAFDVLQETGYVGVPDTAFSNVNLAVKGSYVRFALGVERMN